LFGLGTFAHVPRSKSSRFGIKESEHDRCINQRVWVTLRGHEPAPGLALRWTERNGLPWAGVTFEMDGRFRAERLPRLALRARDPHAAS